ncbi:DUF2924 domain-containing protein [Lysobacter sp. Hz 25]|uniref:DUF2924 domain-containing protein n=1 Tax=Lysobacter sp. Hz 25 TaxID=3383698 RepID=UPI0038D41D98
MTSQSLKETASIAGQIAALPDLPWNQLRTRWIALFGEPPGINNRRYVVRRLAHRIQEDAYRLSHPGLIDDNSRRISQLLETGRVSRRPVRAAPLLGTVLTRVHNGHIHRVVVLAGGLFEYQGQQFSSLSKVAREITGTRWSGPAFFGLRNQASKKGVGNDL